MGGYVLAALAILGWRHWNIKVAEILEQANTLVKEANQNLTAPVRVKLTCPWCDWEETVVQVGMEAAVEAGNERIKLHNAEVGHMVISGKKPRTGYYKGSPLN